MTLLVKRSLVHNSFRIAHVLMKRKNTLFAKLSLYDQTMKIAAKVLPVGKHAVNELKQILLSNDTMNNRSTMIGMGQFGDANSAINRL